MTATDILRDLIAFPTISVDPNRALIDYCADLLTEAGAEVQIIEREKDVVETARRTQRSQPVRRVWAPRR